MPVRWCLPDSADGWAADTSDLAALLARRSVTPKSSHVCDQELRVPRARTGQGSTGAAAGRS